MSAAGLIYVAGNPDLYPLEYYDPESGTYQGVIPAFLAQFAQESGCTVQYFQPGETDRRAELAKNQQVDLISGCVDDAIEGEQIPLFCAQLGGDTTAYHLVLTDVAPDFLAEALRSYLSGVPQDAWTGSVLHAVQQNPQHNTLLPLTAALGAAACLLMAALALALRRMRRMGRQTEENHLRDPDTGLYRQEYLLRRFPALVRDDNRALYHVAYFYLDLPHIEWRDSPAAAKALLRRTAAALEQQLGGDGIVCRAADGGFAALINAGSPRAAEARCLAAIDQIGEADDPALAAGIYPLQAGDHDLPRILFLAEQCARMAFRAESPCLICSDDLRRAFEEERQLIADMDSGFARDEFRIYLQFYVSAAQRRIVGGEMLARWQHARKGLLLPAQFVPLLEREGRVSRLDYYCLEKVCAFLEQLDRQGVRDFFISCNFARSTVTSPHFVEKCQAIISRYHFVRELLIFEVTESEKSPDYTQMNTHIQAMRAFGVRVIFDDFGVGFSSLHDLQESVMDGLKLDKYLVQNIGTRQGRSILEAMIRAGHELGLTILAEGVEEETQAAALQQLQCDVLQGFYFSHPLPAGEAAGQIIRQFRPPDDLPQAHTQPQQNRTTL